MPNSHDPPSRRSVRAASALRAALVVGLAACTARPSERAALPGNWALGPACPGAPVIAVREPGAPCQLAALPPGWRAAALFERGSPGVASLVAAVPEPLRRYCSYQWSGDGDPVGAYAAMRAALDDHPGVRAESASPDCQVASMRGVGALDDAIARAERDAFRLDIGWVPREALGEGERAPVVVAVADTVSAEIAADPRRAATYNHGEVVAAIIADIACPEGQNQCRVGLRHTLALPRNDPRSPPSWVEGGIMGARSDVALAIYEAVARWREQGPGRPPRLVLNLSLGWSPSERGGLAPSRALIDALRFATCHGALVFASAGHARGDAGPLEPARFEALDAPDRARCLELGLLAEREPDVYPTFGPTRPLVVAVGGVDGEDRALAHARAGRPRLAAPAADGLGERPDGQLTRSLTGDSIAAAVASGAAALLWSYHPELRPDEVVEHLYASGWDLGAVADFGREGAEQTIRRIHVCSALAHSCAERPSASCPPLDCRASAPAGREHRRGLRRAMDARHQAEGCGTNSILVYWA